MNEEKKKRPVATVAVVILKEGKVLIGKRKDTASHGKGEYSFPGGHIEFGESFEEAVKREAFEESGVEIKNIQFLSVVNVDLYNKVLIGVTADWDKGEIITRPEENIGDWQWLDVNDLPSPLFYPTEVLVDSYKSGQKYYDKK